MKVCGRSKKIEKKWERNWVRWDIGRAGSCCYGRNFPLFYFDNPLPPHTWPAHRYSSYRECTDMSIPHTCGGRGKRKWREFWKSLIEKEGVGEAEETNVEWRVGGVERGNWNEEKDERERMSVKFEKSTN